MAGYRVKYEIDVEANDAIGAAKEAYECMVDPASMLPILEVTPLPNVRTFLASKSRSRADAEEPIYSESVEIDLSKVN